MARGPRKLKVTQGTDQANDGTQRFLVDPDGYVTVPGDIADRLLSGGGFLDVTDPPAQAPTGMVKLSHPTATGCSWGGQSYAPNGSGHFLVPVMAEPDLAAHGFERVPDAPADAEPEAVEQAPAAESEPEAEAEA